jgi:hypothetical protein
VASAKRDLATAKLFNNGRSQAVRLPKQFRFEGSAVSVRREGEAVILEPLKQRAWPRGYWRRWGKATKGLELVEPLAPGCSSLDLDRR